MDDRQAFMNAIIADIDNDLPRLVFADWLEEHGEPDRAEFIRVQCELASLPADAPHRPQLEAREAELLARYGYEWAEEYGRTIGNFIYRRGFIEDADVDFSFLNMLIQDARDAYDLEEAPAADILDLLNRVPIRDLHASGQVLNLGTFADVIEQFQPNRLTGLTFWDLWAGDDAIMRRILMAPALGSLRTLIVCSARCGGMVGDEVLIKALRSPLRSRIETLGVDFGGKFSGASPAVLQAMADSPHLRQLRTLLIPDATGKFDEPQEVPELLEHFGRSPNFASLRHLDLSKTCFSEASWQAVLRWPFLARLERLWLSRSCLRVAPATYGEELSSLPEWKARFEGACPSVEWDAEGPHRWNDTDFFPKGLEWGDRRHFTYDYWRPKG